MFYKMVKLGLSSDPQIFLKLRNGISDLKGLGTTMMNKHYYEGKADFFSDHTLAVVKFNKFDKRAIIWKQELHQRTENYRVYELSGPG